MKLTYSTFLMAAGLVALVTGATAEVLPTHPKEPDAIIFESGDIGGRNAFAKARVTKESAIDWCGNWYPGDPLKPCVDRQMKGEAGRVFEAKANCYSGELTSIFGDKYKYDGIWQNTEFDFWDGTIKFTDVATGKPVGLSNAAGGRMVASQWETLCPQGAPLDKKAVKMVLTPEDSSGFGELVGHNGSGILIDARNGTMSYSVLSKKMEGFIPEGTVLFRGKIVPNGAIDGMAYTFKKGCDPAPYRVRGHYPDDSDKLVLRGKSPVRKGCKVVGYTDKSPNAKLVFDLPHD